MKNEIFDIIRDEVCQYYSIYPDELVTRNRKRSLVQARQLIFYFAIEYQTGTLSEIGMQLNRDHATVLHSMNHIKGLIEFDKFLKIDFENIKQSLKNKIIEKIEIKPRFKPSHTGKNKAMLNRKRVR